MLCLALFGLIAWHYPCTLESDASGRDHLRFSFFRWASLFLLHPLNKLIPSLALFLTSIHLLSDCFFIFFSIILLRISSAGQFIMLTQSFLWIGSSAGAKVCGLSHRLDAISIRIGANSTHEITLIFESCSTRTKQEEGSCRMLIWYERPTCLIGMVRWRLKGDAVSIETTMKWSAGGAAKENLPAKRPFPPYSLLTLHHRLLL